MAEENKVPEKILKNLVVDIYSDCSGTGYIPNINPMMYLNAVMGPANVLKFIFTPTLIFDNHILAQTRSIIFQRFMNPEMIPVIEQYKRVKSKFGYQMIIMLDDFIFNRGDGKPSIPEFSYCSDNIKDHQGDSFIQMAAMMDKIVVSTQSIKDFLIKEGSLTGHNIVVHKNTVPSYFFGTKIKRKIKEPLKKPKVLYSGSGCHYSNDKKLLGDFASGEWAEWAIENVLADKIDLMVMGGLPWFFEPIKDKIKLIEWVNSYQYYSVLNSFKPDITIALLVPDIFNSCKSDLRAIESFALNAVCIGSVFNDGTPSPYDNIPVTVNQGVTKKELNDLLEYLKIPENFNKIIQSQHQYLEADGRWTESPKNIERLMQIL